MAPKARPWNDCFSDLRREDIARLSKYQPPALIGLEDEDRARGRQRLDAALKLVFTPTEQTDDLIWELAVRVHHHREGAYPDGQTYLARLNSRRLPATDYFITCFTGLAGVGKSQLALAFRRVMQGPTQVCVGAMYGPFPHEPVLLAKVTPNISKVGLGEVIAEQLGLPPDTQVGLQKALYACGSSMLMMDETQFLTGTSATTKVTNTMYWALEFGLPVVCIQNYSLVPLLAERHSHDRQRLLSDPLVLYPDPADSKGWLDTIDDCVRVAPGVFAISARNDHELLHQCTGGIRRSLRELLALAYRLTPRGGRVTAAVVERAYASSEYSDRRSELRVLANPSAARKRLRKSFTCPFPGAERQAAAAASVKAHDQQRQQIKMFLSVLTPREKSKVDTPTSTPKADKVPASVVGLPKGGSSPEALLRGHEAVLRSIQKKGKP
jgi:hypothetical protein